MADTMRQTRDNSTKARNDVNCLRKCKRSIRRKIGWNKCPMRYQLRVHLFTLFGSFFALFFTFLALYAKYFYQHAVVKNLSTEWPQILENRLVYSSQAVSTAFYMADKAFIDSVKRLRDLYHEASKEPFPIRADAYPVVTDAQLAAGRTIYGLSCYCNFAAEDAANYKAVNRMHKIWEQALLRRLGSEKNVNGSRILILYTNQDYECVYPAQLFPDKDEQTLLEKTELVKKVRASQQGIYIERNAKYLYDRSEQIEYNNYWMLLEDELGAEIGVIGFQFEIRMYNMLIPSPVIEEPYQLSFINLYDRDHNSIWGWGCTDCNQDADIAKSIIDREYAIQGDQYVQWQIPKVLDVADYTEVPFVEDIEGETQEETRKTSKTKMKVQNQLVPLIGVNPHGLYDEKFEMSIYVGHSAELGYVMDDHLHEEISRGLWWFMLSLLGGVAICFIFFSYCFERRLQSKVTKPIAELSKQIKNPKEFMAARNKTTDIYNNRKSVPRKQSTQNAASLQRQNSDLLDSDRTTDGVRTTDQSREGEEHQRGSSIGRTKVGKMMNKDYQRQREQDEKMAKLKSINEVQALRGVFYNFFEMKAVQGSDAASDKVLISMQVAESNLNPFFNEDDQQEKSDANFAYASNCSGLFEHLHRLSRRREEDANFDSRYQERTSFAANANERQREDMDLDPIQEDPNDETDPQMQRLESHEMNLGEDDDPINKPMIMAERRATMISEGTVATDFFNEESSEDYGEDDQPPWVDNVKLRHGMDWLDLIKTEVDRNTAQIDKSLMKTYRTEETV